MDKEKKNLGSSGSSGHNDQVDQLLRKLNPEMKRAKPGPEALAAALEAVERMAAFGARSFSSRPARSPPARGKPPSWLP